MAHAPGHDQDDGPLSGAVRRAMDGALNATVGRVGHQMTEAALDVTGATAQQIIADLEPYLIEEAVPRILEGITPYLVTTGVPGIVDGLTEHLVSQTVPEIVSGLTDYLVEVTVPEIVIGLTPRLVEDLLPEILVQLEPYLEAELVPRIVDGLMPKIRNDIVPTVLEDIVDDPRVRDLIREQSQGLFLDALESLRENMADVDDVADGVGRRLLRRPRRPEPQHALDLVVEATEAADTRSRSVRLDDLVEQRRALAAMPAQPSPPGREHAYAGAVTRLLGFGIDVTAIGWLVSQGLSAIVSLLDRLLDPAPDVLIGALTMAAAAMLPVYLGLCWWIMGRSLGSWLVGTRVCMPDGRNPGFLRALVRAWVGMVGIIVWVVTGVVSLVDPKRRTVLDLLLHTEVRYVVPDVQQRRYIRSALLEASKQASSEGAPAPSRPTV